MIEKYKHIIWDWNGTIFNDVELGVEIINGMLAGRGITPLTTELYREKFTIPVQDYYSVIGFDFTKEPFEVVGKEWMEEYERRKYECGLYDGIIDLFEKIEGLGIGQSILSAYSQHTLEEMVDHFNLRKYLEHIAGLDNIYAASKMNLGRELMGKLGHGHGETILIGDTEHDYEVAAGIGSDCLLIANGHQSRNKLLTLGVPVIDDIRSLLV